MPDNQAMQDSLLVQQAIAGDVTAFRRLMHQHAPWVLAYVRHLVTNPADAEELTNEVFLKAYRALESLEHPQCFQAWLHRIAFHHCQDWLRRHWDRTLPLDTLPEVALVDVGQESAEQRLLREERLSKVLAAIETLPAPERELMQGFYLEELSYDALEHRHGLSRDAIRMRLFKARQKVRQRVKALLGGIVWTRIGRKLLTGGMEAMKLGMKAKVTISGVAAMLALGGAIVWHASQPIVDDDWEAEFRQNAETGAGLHQKGPAQPAVVHEKTEDVDAAVDGVVEDTLTWPDSLEKEVPEETSRAGAEPSGTIELTTSDANADANVSEEAKQQAAKLLVHQQQLVIQISEAVNLAGKRQRELIQKLGEEGRGVNSQGNTDSEGFFIIDSSGERVHDPELEYLNERIRNLKQEFGEIMREIDRIYPGSLRPDSRGSLRLVLPEPIYVGP